ARSPRQRLRRAEREDDRKLASVHDWRVMVLDQYSATGPSRIPAARTENAAIQADGLSGPPAASSATPIAHAPNADRPKPTVECVAIVAPRYAGLAAIAMPEVNAPESAGVVMA